MEEKVQSIQSTLTLNFSELAWLYRSLEFSVGRTTEKLEEHLEGGYDKNGETITIPAGVYEEYMEYKNLKNTIEEAISVAVTKA